MTRLRMGKARLTSKAFASQLFSSLSDRNCSKTESAQHSNGIECIAHITLNPLVYYRGDRMITAVTLKLIVCLKDTPLQELVNEVSLIGDGQSHLFASGLDEHGVSRQQKHLPPSATTRRRRRTRAQGSSVGLTRRSRHLKLDH